MFGEGGRAKFIAARRPPDEKLNVVWIDMSRDQWGGGDSMKHWNGLTWANWAANDTVTDVIYQRIQYAEDTSTAALAAADQASINSANTIGEVNELATELATVKDLAGEANQNALDALSNIPDKIDKSAIERSAIHGTRTVLTAIAPTKISKSEVEITAFNSNVEAPGTYTQSTMKIKGQDGIEFESDPEGLVIKATDADCVPKEAIERSDISGKRTVLTAVAPTNVSASEIEITAFNSDVENKGTYTQSILKIKGEGTIEFAADPEGLIIKSNAQSDGISKDCIERSDTSKKRTVVTAVAPTNITADEIEITQFSSDIDDKNTFTQSVLKIKGGGAIGFEADTDGIIIKAEVPAAPSVPTALPTPNKLKIGSYEFDGSTEVNATFPAIPTKLPNPYTLRLWKCLDEFSADVYDLDYDGSTNVSVTSKLLKLVDANDNVVGTYKPLINGNITNNVTTIKLPAIPTSAPTSGSYDFQVIYNWTDGNAFCPILMFDLPDQIVSAEELSFSSDFVIRYALEDTNAASFDGVTFYGTFTYRIAANYPTFGEDISAFTAHPNILGSPSGSDVAKCKIDVVALAGRTRITSGYNATVDNFGLFSVDKTSADVLCNAHLHLHLPHLYSLFSYVSDRDSRKLYISGSLTNYKCISAGQYTNTGKTWITRSVTRILPESVDSSKSSRNYHADYSLQYTGSTPQKMVTVWDKGV